MLHPLPLPLSSCLGCIPPLIGLPSLRFYAVGSSLFLLSVCFCLCSLFYRDDVLCWLLLARPFLYAFHAHLRFPVDLVWFRLSCDHGWIRSGSVNVRNNNNNNNNNNNSGSFSSRCCTFRRTHTSVDPIRILCIRLALTLTLSQPPGFASCARLMVCVSPCAVRLVGDFSCDCMFWDERGGGLTGQPMGPQVDTAMINISVQYNGGFLPDIILLTQGYYQWGTRLNTM